MRFLNWLDMPARPGPGWRLAIALGLGIVLLGAFWQSFQLELWNDEVYSLLYFQRVPPLRTLTDYHETNNHVLFNFMQNLWLRIVGNPPVDQLFRAPWILRIPPFIYAWITAGTLTFGLLRRYGPATAILGLILLLTSIPYCNFALQGRAYGLLIMIGSLQLFGFLSYLDRGGTRRLLVQAILAFMLFYAHPAGLYLGVGWITATVACFTTDLRKNDLRRQRAYYACGIWICGLAAAGLAYLPIMRQILHNPWVGSKTVSPGTFFRDTFLSVLRQLIGGQWWLLVLLLAGAVATGFLRKAPVQRRIVIYCAAIVLCTYIMPLVRRDEAPQRTFTMLIPYLTAGMAIAAAGLRAQFGDRRLALLAPALSVVLAIQFPVLLERRNRTIESAIHDGVELSSIENAYYLHLFNPEEIVRKAGRFATLVRIPVYAAIAYRQELPHYLEAAGLPWLEYRSPAQRAALPDSALIITSMIPEFRRRYASELDFQIVDSTGGFYELLKVRKRR